MPRTNRGKIPAPTLAAGPSKDSGRACSRGQGPPPRAASGVLKRARAYAGTSLLSYADDFARETRLAAVTIEASELQSKTPVDIGEQSTRVPSLQRSLQCSSLPRWLAATGRQCAAR